MKRCVGVVAVVLLLGVGSVWAVPVNQVTPGTKTPGKRVEGSLNVLGHEVLHAEFDNKSKMSDVHNELTLNNAKIINPAGNLDVGVLENKSGGEMHGVSSQLEINGNSVIMNEGGEGSTRVGSTSN